MLVILPTSELLDEPEHTRDLLDRIDVTLEILAESILAQWAQIEGEWGHGYNPFDMSTLNLILTSLYADFLHSEVFHRLPKEDQHEIVRVVNGFCHSFYHDIIISMLEDMELSPYQLQTLRFHKWLGKSMVIDVVN